MSDASSAGRIGIEVHEGPVRPEWIDINRHVNVAYYVLAFDLGVDALWSRFGITQESIERTGGSTFAVECHVTYQAELDADDAYVVTSEILAFDAKRLHQFQRMYRQRDDALVATCEWMNLFVDLGSRKVALWPDEVLARIRAVATAQTPRNRSLDVGRRMRVPQPLYTLDPDYPLEDSL